MLKRIVLCVFCAVVCLSYPAWVIAQEEAGITPAPGQDPVAAAQTWLAMVDEGQFNASWETASAYFKGMISQEKWASQVAAVREPLGSLVLRELGDKKYLTTLPAAPDGKYYVMSFNTEYSNKASAVETVTVVLEEDGRWRLAGYYIK